MLEMISLLSSLHLIFCRLSFYLETLRVISLQEFFWLENFLLGSSFLENSLLENSLLENS